MRAAAILTYDKFLSPGQTTANNCKMAFSLHVVESASDDYSFQFRLEYSSDKATNKYKTDQSPQNCFFFFFKSKAQQLHNCTTQKRMHRLSKSSSNDKRLQPVDGL